MIRIYQDNCAFKYHGNIIKGKDSIGACCLSRL